MSNHSPEEDGAMNRFMERAAEAEELGATNQFPEGKITPQDEGELRLAMTTVDDKIILNFGRPISWIGFTGEQAFNLAKMLRKGAKKVRPGHRKGGR